MFHAALHADLKDWTAALRKQVQHAAAVAASEQLQGPEAAAEHQRQAAVDLANQLQQAETAGSHVVA